MTRVSIVVNDYMQSQGVNSVVDQYILGRDLFRRNGIDIQHVVDCRKIYTDIPKREVANVGHRSNKIKARLKNTIIYSNRISESCILYFKVRQMGISAAEFFLQNKSESDLVLVQDVFAAYRILNRQHTCKVIYMTHMYYDEYEQLKIKYPHTVNSLINRYVVSIYDYVFKHADKVITICNKAKESIVNKHQLLSNSVCVIYNAIKDEKIRSNPGANERVQFVSASSLNVRKGSDLLLEVLGTQSNKVHNNAEFHIFGAGDYLSKLELLSKDVDNVHVYGRVANPLSFYKDKDVFLLTSRDECLPMGIIEALSAGMPVIATNVGAISEMISHGKNGWLITPAVDDIKKAIEYVIDNRNLLKDMGQESLNSYNENFTSERWINEFSEVFNSLQ